METLHVLIFDGRYYVGKASEDGLSDVVELTPVFRPADGKIINLPCFLGDLIKPKSTEYLITRLSPKSVLHSGYVEVMNILNKRIAPNQSGESNVEVPSIES